MQIFSRRKKIVQEVAARKMYKEFIYHEKFTLRQLKRKKYVKMRDADYLYSLALHIEAHYTNAENIVTNLIHISERLHKGVKNGNAKRK